MHKPVSLFTLVALAIAAAWWWLGGAVTMPPSPLAAGEKLYCISYAPFRGAQTPLDLSTMISPAQIEQDFAQLSKLTDCVRTYSVDFGLDKVPEIAARHGLKVLLGLWVSSHADRTEYQLNTGVALAKRFPDVIRAIVVGNEALLRGEVAPDALGEMIRSVKAQVSMPVTYADVWEFWLRNRSLADAADFVTIHILPYWEDDPVPADQAAAHVDAIRRKVAAEFPGKEVLIGEVGWPSAGRMRVGALPSPANQALALTDILTKAKAEHFHVNLIETYDQPWKRFLEGTVGGHWGIIDDANRKPKFVWGMPVSNHPRWVLQALGGIVFAAVVFGAALAARRRAAKEPTFGIWTAIAASAATGGILVGWTAENAPLESLGLRGWAGSLAFLAVAAAAPVVAAAALATGDSIPTFAQMIGPKDARRRDPLGVALGVLAIALCILAIQAALGLAFNPRYLDFPFAPLTAAAVPLALVAFAGPRPSGRRAVAETVAAGILTLSAAFIVFNETLANWQAVWTALALVVVALTLARARHAPD